jgi:SAM-dependent methyltransferase
VALDDVLAEQIRYYRARAGEYDNAYVGASQHDRETDANAAWQAELARLVAVFDGVPLGDSVLEVAAGTGYWTAKLVDRGATVTAIDAAPEMLEVNRRRLGDRARSVRFIVADLFEWRPTRQWDSCIGCFWLAKVPDERLHAFLRTVAIAVRPGGRVFFGDKTLSMDGPPPSELEVRSLEDGRTFTIIDRPRSSSEFRRAFAAVDIDVEVVVVGEHFSAVVGTRSDPSA